MLWLMANNQGELVIEPQYDSPSAFYEGVAFVDKNGEKFLIDKKGSILSARGFRGTTVSEFTLGIPY